METPLEMYKRVIQGQPVCEDGWFGDAIARYRSGDESARGQILGSALRVSFDMVEKQLRAVGDDVLLEYIQDANAALPIALERFKGTKADEFLGLVKREVCSVLSGLQPNADGSRLDA